VINKKNILAELETKTKPLTTIGWTLPGSYLKVGFDHNAYENWLDMENVISIGLRYGFSTLVRIWILLKLQ
jgi:hypothetical protein